MTPPTPQLSICGTSSIWRKCKCLYNVIVQTDRKKETGREREKESVAEREREREGNGWREKEFICLCTCVRALSCFLCAWDTESAGLLMWIPSVALLQTEDRLLSFPTIDEHEGNHQQYRFLLTSMPWKQSQLHLVSDGCQGGKETGKWRSILPCCRLGKQTCGLCSHACNVCYTPSDVFERMNRLCWIAWQCVGRTRQGWRHQRRWLWSECLAGFGGNRTRCMCDLSFHRLWE